jgi:hypothetical protein
VFQIISGPNLSREATSNLLTKKTALKFLGYVYEWVSLWWGKRKEKYPVPMPR